MRRILLFSASAIGILAAISSTNATPAPNIATTYVTVSPPKTGIRLAEAKGPKNNTNVAANNNTNGNPGGDHEKSNSPCNRNGFVVSPSHPNNGFGNCGQDGIPGGSGKNITNDETR